MKKAWKKPEEKVVILKTSLIKKKYLRRMVNYSQKVREQNT